MTTKPTRLVAAICLSVIAMPHALAEFPEIKNSQKPGEEPPSAAEAAAAITVPDGFNVTLFAGEPDVHQPIAFDIDDRGRLFVAENYTYTGRGFTDDFNDRIIILQDTDQDGRHDVRKVFWDEGKRLSGVTLGFGGVWALNFGKLIFIPDKDGDDKPDGEPVVLLDGFECQKAAHNVVNGLMWGPDGWLYGRHGIQALSIVGAPGTPEEERTKLNCAIWRYHPTRKVFEVVCHGTTNPWGMDYNEYGEFFFTNNVLGHLWHVIPGAHYKRMYGQHFNPYLYELIDQTADHYHWDTKKQWHEARDATGVNDEAGGGHSHCGGMIYLGDNWPDEHRGRLFMCNTHGRRINVNVLERKGCGYVGKRAPDFLHANQPWFRGIELKYGPDGGVYLSDWTDHGECHDSDGVHRTSGRIYKITYGEAKKLPADFDISKQSDADLLKAQRHKNAWHARHARRVLQERAVYPAGDRLGYPFMLELQSLLDNQTSVTLRLRALWTHYLVTGALPAEYRVLAHAESEHVRAWVIRLLIDHDKGIVGRTATLLDAAKMDQSGLVRLYVASALQKLPLDERWPLAEALLQREQDADDPVQPLMIWYGIEPAVAADKDRALKLAAVSRMPKVRQFIARRIAEKDEDTQPDGKRP